MAIWNLTITGTVQADSLEEAEELYRDGEYDLDGHDLAIGEPGAILSRADLLNVAGLLFSLADSSQEEEEQDSAQSFAGYFCRLAGLMSTESE